MTLHPCMQSPSTMQHRGGAASVIRPHSCSIQPMLSGCFSLAQAVRCQDDGLLSTLQFSPHSGVNIEGTNEQLSESEAMYACSWCWSGC